jgi:hypothetical protein
MGNFLNKGNAGFTSVRKSTYVDKSGMIAFINSTLGTKNKLICVSRPRRFGKSFMAQMLSAYYDKTCDSRSLFEDLEIANDASFEENLNKYDVIYIDMTWFVSYVGDIKQMVGLLEKKLMDELYEIYPNAKICDNLSEAMASVCSITGGRFIFIIDEWDALFREAKDDEKIQKEYIWFLRRLFKSPFTDDTIEAAYITGILPVKKYGTQSAMTDFKEYSMISPKKLAKYVGFTEMEVKNLCEEYNMNFEMLKHWYDGYSFAQVKSVYNPNSVMEAVTNGEIESYWTQTETFESLKMYIDMDYEGLKQDIVQMLVGKCCKVKVIGFENDMTSIKSKDDILTLLVHLGYLAYDADNKTVRIPNEEIRREFMYAVETGSRKELAKLIQTSDSLLEATLEMNEEFVAATIEVAHSEGCTPLYYNNEQALRSVVKFAYISCVDEFLRIEELPSGKGYADVVYLPKKNSDKPIMVVELKWNKTAGGAIAQIKERKYPQIFDGFGSDILLVGINYDERTKEHSCRIEKNVRERNNNRSQL